MWRSINYNCLLNCMIHSSTYNPNMIHLNNIILWDNCHQPLTSPRVCYPDVCSDLNILCTRNLMGLYNLLKLSLITRTLRLMQCPHQSINCYIRIHHSPQANLRLGRYNHSRQLLQLHHSPYKVMRKPCTSMSRNQRNNPTGIQKRIHHYRGNIRFRVLTLYTTTQRYIPHTRRDTTRILNYPYSIQQRTYNEQIQWEWTRLHGMSSSL